MQRPRSASAFALRRNNSNSSADTFDQLQETQNYTGFDFMNSSPERGRLRRQKDIPVTISSPSRFPKYKRPANIVKGYSGVHLLSEHSTDVLERPYSRGMIRGYSGHIPGIYNITGKAIIKEQLGGPRTTSPRRDVQFDEEELQENTNKEVVSNFRSYGKHMDICDRYDDAIRSLEAKGQTQNMLIRLMQSKLSERVNSYAQQQIWMRKIFESFDAEGKDALNEYEFRRCLEKFNIQFDDIQFLALFAAMDKDLDGSIDWKEFAAVTMVPNPKGGTAVLTKPITSPWNSVTWAPIERIAPIEYYNSIK